MNDSLVTLATRPWCSPLLPLTAPRWEPFGSRDDEVVPSGFTIFDEHPDPRPPPNCPVAETAPQRGQRAAGVLREVLHFLGRGGVTRSIRDAPAPCDCATGACE